jgi:16S rRNA (guanine527-N7)-methyltransferase
VLREKISRRAAKAGCNPSPALLDALASYFELLRKWNRKVSLTALPVEEASDEAIDRLLLEPLVAARYVPPHATVIDIGSGGGSPAIPLKLAAVSISIRMVESKIRKAAFLREVVRALSLSEAEVDAVRFEELLARPELHEAVDAVTIRAVKVEARTLAGLQAFLKPGGVLLLFRTESRPRSEAASPQLVPEAVHSLLKQWGSQLEILRKGP